MTDTAKKDDGGAAFPQEIKLPRTGMSLRDYAAIHIAQGILAGGWADTVPLDDVQHAEQLASFAFAAADAMLAERNKP